MSDAAASGVIARTHRALRATPRHDAAGRGRRHVLGRAGAAHGAPRRHPGPRRRAGHRHRRVAGTQPGSGGGPDHVSDLLAAAGRAARLLRARAIGLRRVLRLRRLRGGHGSLLGAQPRAGIPERHTGPAARRRDGGARARRHGRGLGLPVRAGGSHGRPRPGAAADAPGLGAPLRPRQRTGRGRGRLGRRRRARVPGAGGPDEAARLRDPGGRGDRRRARIEPGHRRAPARSRGPRVRDPRPRLRDGRGGPAPDPAPRHRPRRAGAGARTSPRWW